MDFLRLLLCTLSAYLIGSFPTSIWISKLFYGIDIREHGSGSASHMNVSRIIGPRISLLVRILDLSKGFLAANLAYFVHNQYGIFSEYELPILMMTLGLAAILGHIFPIFEGFRGGKGIHVSLGVLIAIQPLASALFALCALLIYLISRYPNLGYVIGALSIPVYVLLTGAKYGEMKLPMIIFSLFLFGILLFSHWKNIREILAQEPAHSSAQKPENPKSSLIRETKELAADLFHLAGSDYHPVPSWLRAGC